MIEDLFLLTVLWVLWCTLHSLLIHPWVNSWFRRILGKGYTWFRLFYNGVALLTIIPILAWGLSFPDPKLLVWHWPWTCLEGTSWLVAAWLFLAGARAYPLAEFLGISQVRKGWGRGGGNENRQLVKKGVLGLVRHPWYLAALILLWTRDLDSPGLVTSGVLSLYLLIGARLEERKLLAQFGEEYRRYRQEVAMFLPWKRFRDFSR